jgi:NAD(P)-dependent dehydrogenase (short-subunit alcohol dehydrogenase family)
MVERTVLITGCSSGFGLGLAQRFAECGWTVLAGVRDLERCPPELARPSPARAQLQVVPLDLEDDAEIAATATLVERLDCLVNNAGYGLAGPFATYTAEQMARQLRVNMLAPALLTHALLPALVRARGRVINISSLAGETGLPLNSLYSASKHALEGWSEALKYELAAHGVQVALVEPGGHRTRFADNATWGARPASPGSIDERQLAGYRAMRARMIAAPGKHPAAVVETVLRLAEMKTMPLRTRVGRDARVLHALERLLPERVAAAVLGRVFRRRLGELRR